MTVGDARAMLSRPVFGDPVHIEAVHLMEMLAVMGLKGKTLEGVDVECSNCDGEGSCSHCDQECGHCDGTGRITGHVENVDDLSDDVVFNMHKQWLEEHCEVAA